MAAFAPLAFGQETRPPTATTLTRQEPKEESEEEHANEIALILAGTWEHKEDETFFTLGAEYERRLTSRLGIVGEVEYLFKADSWIVAAPLVFHPGHGFKIFGGPGFERAEVEEEEEEAEEPNDVEAHETRFLLRVGTGYAAEFGGRYSFGPSVSLDFVREHGKWERAVVFGVSFGVAF